jgi:hypothetical protein
VNIVDETYQDRIKQMLDPKRSHTLFPKHMRLKSFVGGHWEQMLKKSSIFISKPKKK